MVHAELGCDNHLIAHGTQGLPHHVLVVKRLARRVLTHVALGRIEERVTYFERLANHAGGSGRIHRVAACMSEPHATEPQRRHLDTAFAKHALLHACDV